MELVLTHNNMDFDALAAQYGVTKLYPSARMVLGYPLVGNVRNFLALYRSKLPIVQARYASLDKVTRVFIVDCQHAERLDENIAALVKDNHNHRRPYTIFDHHALAEDGLGPGAESDSVVGLVGACTTIVVEKIRERKIPLSPFEATLFTIGIYEDTGCLTYRGTSDRDAAAVAFLLSQGADLAIVNDHIHPKMNDEQVVLLEDLIKSAKQIQLGGAKIVIATGSRTRYFDGLATLTRKLCEIESADAVFTVVHMRDRVHIVGRSDSRGVDVRPIVQHFSGDGHPGAGSAVSKNGSVEHIAREVEKLIKAQEKPEIRAQEIMSSPVRTIRPNVSMDEASRIMIRYGLDGLVVSDNDEMVGVISRRDIDQAKHHKLGHAPVVGFMSRPVISIKPDETLSKLQQIMVKEDIGRLPVLDENNKLVGLVTRQDVLRTLYGTAGEAPLDWDAQRAAMGSRARVVVDLNDKMESLSPSTLWLCREVGEMAEQMGMTAYLVGGCVRDLVLGLPNFDLDFVIEGSAIELAKAMESAYPARLELVAKHDRFQTATLTYFAETKREVDFSTARTEFYEFPAALPTVEASQLGQDLLRRDFTINALAVCLNPSEFGMLMDHFDGLEDIKHKVVRILHAFSFIEDPTRIVRAARFASRLGFNLDAKSKEQAKRAIGMGIFDDLGGVRIKAELRLILESPHRIKALNLLSEVGGKLRYLDRDLEYGPKVKHTIRRAERLLAHYTVDEPWDVYLGLLVSGLPLERVRPILERLHLANNEKETIIQGLQIAAQFFKQAEPMKRSQVYALLHGKPRGSLAIAACLAPPGSALRRMTKLYIEELADMHTELTGTDLVNMGFPQSAIIGQILEKLLALRLDGAIKSKDDELETLNTHFSAHRGIPSPKY